MLPPSRCSHSHAQFSYAMQTVVSFPEPFETRMKLSCVHRQAFGGGNRAQELALSYQRSRCWHAVQSVRSLSGLCVASHAEDRLGTAQLAQPNLGLSGCMAHVRTACCALSMTAKSSHEA